MKCSAAVIIFFATYATVCSQSEASPTNSTVKYASTEFLTKQKFFLEILRNIYQPLDVDEYLPFTKGWITDSSKYKDYKTVVKFFDLFKSGYLPKGEIFTIFNYWYLRQTKLLFHFFYNCVDWDTYHKNVIWARENINEGMFIYALTLSVIHRKDLNGISLPAIYEINPFLFFNGDLIHDATTRKLLDRQYGYYQDVKSNAAMSNFSVKLATKYYGEGKLAYYTEDIGMNAYYFYFMLEYAPFLEGEEFGLNKDRRGELYFYMHQQLVARYYLERQSSGLGLLSPLTWDFPLKTGYYSMLRYWNGLPVRSREDNFNMRSYDPMKLKSIKDYELRISQAIDNGYFLLSNGTKIDLRMPSAIDTIGNMVSGNVDSINAEYFKSLDVGARMILAQGDYYGSSDELWPGAMMHYETSMRDPIYYQFLESILGFYSQFKSYLPPYSLDDLSFKDVEITDLKLDKLVTYFDYFDADINNAVPFANKLAPGKDTWNSRIFARTKRLNHKPFNYTLSIRSQFVGKGVVRMYMMPKSYGLTSLQLMRRYAVEMDQYLVDLTVGDNFIARSTKDFYYDIRDRTTYTELYKRIMQGLRGEKQYVLDMSEAFCGWPDRLLLPKGRNDGFEMTFFFIISPFKPPKVPQYSTYDASNSCGTGSGSKYLDDLPFGFPFDREIDASYFITKNMLFKDVLIFHLNN